MSLLSLALSARNSRTTHLGPRNWNNWARLSIEIVSTSRLVFSVTSEQRGTRDPTPLSSRSRALRTRRPPSSTSERWVSGVGRRGCLEVTRGRGGKGSTKGVVLRMSQGLGRKRKGMDGGGLDLAGRQQAPGHQDEERRSRVGKGNLSWDAPANPNISGTKDMNSPR